MDAIATHTRTPAALRKRLTDALLDVHDECLPTEALTDAALAALGLNDLDVFADRVLDGLPLGEPAFPAVRRSRMRQALEAALSTTDGHADDGEA
jgi:hypothetical protein